MFTMQINQRPVWYAQVVGKQPTYDEYGNETGEYRIEYTNPIRAEANISPARGEADTRQFGVLGKYDMTLTMSNTDISESTILWIDVLSNGVIPVDPDGEYVMHDYEVAKIAPSLNSVVVAVRQVHISQ